MRIVCSFRGNQRTLVSSGTELIFGRADGKFPIGLDLTPDQKVSRLHGRIWFEAGSYWIEDLGSSRGTKLNGIEIKGSNRQRLRSNDEIAVGETTLVVDNMTEVSDVTSTNYLADGAALPVNEDSVSCSVSISHDLDAQDVSPITVHEDAGDRLKLIYDLPLQFAAKIKLESLLPLVVDSLSQVFSQVESWALVLHDPEADRLLLKAYRHAHHPNLSETLARRAMRDKKAFIWRSIEGDITESIMASALQVGMYAPLLWQGEALGVVCGGGTSSTTQLTENDLRLLVLVAQYAAMAVASHKLQEELVRESAIKANLLRQFSPKVAERLLATRGNLKLGGERSSVTILNADIRGFSKLVEKMDPDDVVHMLNEYFGVMVPIIFANKGTVDKFLGDAILVVFGSPEPDSDQHEHAVHTALQMQEAIENINETHQQRNMPCPRFGIGIHSGEVIHGFVGAKERMEFTVISDAVNKTSRYCAAAAGGEVLISPDVRERIWQIFDSEAMSIDTKHEGTLAAYRVTGRRKLAEKAG
ncbi:MAG: adenylate/guanylate cyclase domain-containing protein [Terriglobales bacterium]